MSVDNYENIQARDIQDLIRSKEKQTHESKKKEVGKMLALMRNQTLASIVCVNVVVAGLFFHVVTDSLIICCVSVLGLKMYDSIMDILKAKKE